MGRQNFRYATKPPSRSQVKLRNNQIRINWILRKYNSDCVTGAYRNRLRVNIKHFTIRRSLLVCINPHSIPIKHDTFHYDCAYLHSFFSFFAQWKLDNFVSFCHSTISYPWIIPSACVSPQQAVCNLQFQQDHRRILPLGVLSSPKGEQATRPDFEHQSVNISTDLVHSLGSISLLIVPVARFIVALALSDMLQTPLVVGSRILPVACGFPVEFLLLPVMLTVLTMLMVPFTTGIVLCILLICTTRLNTRLPFFCVNLIAT